MAGQEYHCPHCLSSPRQWQPGGHSRPFLARRGMIPRGHGATANVAYAHHNGNGNVFDEMNMKFSKSNRAVLPARKNAFVNDWGTRFYETAKSA
jgi:hypothetical protein